MTSHWDAALGAHRAMHCAFAFDTEILDALGSNTDRSVTFIWDRVRELKAVLEVRGTARSARARVTQSRAQRAISLFTPYQRAWLAKLEPRHIAPHEINWLAPRLAPALAGPMLALDVPRFERAESALPPGMSGGARLWKTFRKRLAGYAERRDFPALAVTSKFSVHLRFGTVSIRELMRLARLRRGAGAQAWLGELVWRGFYFAILAARPGVVDHSFRRAYDVLQWEVNEAGFRAWCEGRTGYPLLDAAMRELNATGAMHNRLRMVTASFLVKDLGIDWRRGERYFAKKLLDYDLAANNGSW